MMQNKSQVQIIFLAIAFSGIVLYLFYHKPADRNAVVARVSDSLQTVDQPSGDACQPVLSAMDILNRNKIDYNSLLRAEFETLSEEQAPSDDQRLVRLVKKLIDPPSTHPVVKHPHGYFQTPQAKAVDDLYKAKNDLFFVECGALDGERSSNTLWLEAKRNWSGLLVEVDPFYYTQIRGKARKSYSINACLSGRIQKLSHSESSGGTGAVRNLNDPQDQYVPCFSLETLMAALDRTTIDYFSLDVEGHEYQVLDGIPWHKLNIRAITVEFQHQTGPPTEAGKDELKAYMKNKGYEFVRQFVETIVCKGLYNRDLLFVKE